MALLKSKPTTPALPRPVPPSLLKGLLNPRPGEEFVLFCDASASGPTITEGGTSRFLQAENWRNALLALGASVPGVITVPVPAPGQGRIQDSAFRAVLQRASCAVVFCETHQPAAWRALLDDYPNLRIALLPASSRQTEDTTLSADGGEVNRRAGRLTDLLARALGVRISFSTGQQAYFDLRFQKPRFRPATCHAGQADRLVTLPGGEVWTGTYAGDGADPWCDTIGIIPFVQNGLMYQYFVEKGRIMDIIGDGAQADRYRRWLEANPEQRVISRLGFGCNLRASSLRNRVEARTAGFFWSIDPLSEPTQLAEPEYLSGQPPLDYHYTQGQQVLATDITLTLEDTSEVKIADTGRVTV
jgi:hypothetical protein